MINNTYTVDKQIGNGGSANVFLAQDLLKNKVVAKVIKEKKFQDEEYARRVLSQEFTIMCLLSQHPNILQCQEVLYDTNVEFGNGNEERINCAILEYAENGTLSMLSRKAKYLDEISASFIFNQILSAVIYMHESNVVHCDIKPQNILLDKYFNVKVSDFGVSQLICTESGLISNRKGTKGFMAPELLPLQRHDEYDPKASDIYALGATLLFIT